MRQQCRILPGMFIGRFQPVVISVQAHERELAFWPLPSGGELGEGTVVVERSYVI